MYGTEASGSINNNNVSRMMRRTMSELYNIV